MSTQLLASKVAIFEEEPRVRGIATAPTSITGAVGVTKEGPFNQAVLCTNFDEYQATFGDFTPASDLALAAMGFFENGGSQLWVVRVRGAGDVTASATMLNLYYGDYPYIHVVSKLPGVAGNGYVAAIVPSTNFPGQYRFTVSKNDVELESFDNVDQNAAGPSFVQDRVNDPDTGSKLVTITFLPSFPLILSGASVTITGGVDGLGPASDAALIGDEGEQTGLHALDNVQDLSVLIVPGYATSAVHNAMLSYCEVFRDGQCFAVLDPPAGASAAAMASYVTTTAALEGASEHAAIYWPRVKALNPSKTVFGSDALVVVPPSGIIAGVYARTAASKPGGVYEQPAGIEAGRLLKVLGFETDETLNERKRDLLYPHRINVLTTGSGLPRFIDGSRTLKGNGNFPSIAERLGVTFIERSLVQGLQFARQKNHTADLRAQVSRTITAFLLTQLQNNAFRSNDPAKAFFVDVSEALNPPSVVFAGKLVARVGLATNKPTEFIVLQISQDTRAIEAQLAGGS